MMKQIIAKLFQQDESITTNNNNIDTIINKSPTTPPPQTIQRQDLEFSNLTIKGKKNSKVKIISNKKNHNYWGNIFRRKRIMSEYFSDSAFGSQSDTKIEFFNPWDDQEKMFKHRAKRILEYEYDENETIPSDISFMNDPERIKNIINSNKENNE